MEPPFRLPPPPLCADDDDDATEHELQPWVLLESKAHVADRCNATTAYCYSVCGREIQVTFCVARPPRVSYLCVFGRAAGGDQDHAGTMFRWDPQVITTEGNIVLLRIHLGTKDGLVETDLFVYRPGGHEGPSLTLLKRPPGDHIFSCTELGLLMFRQDNQGNVSFLRLHRALEDESYMAPPPHSGRPYKPDPAACGRFVLYLYSSKQEAWTTTIVSVEDHQLQQYQTEGCFLHKNVKVIAIGGDDDTIGFVDLWRGILICDLRRVLDHPQLRYILLPQAIVPDDLIFDDARLYRDIAVIEGRIRCVRMGNHLVKNDTWVATSWSRTSSLEDTWRMDYEIVSTNMDVDNPQYELLPKPRQQGDERGPVPVPFKGLSISQPTLSLQNGDATVFFTVQVSYYDAKAWVVAVDMMENKLQAVVEFDAERYNISGFAYLHSRISNYLTRC